MKVNKNSIHKIFSKAAKTYDVLNHVLTLGLDVLWRRKAAKMAVDQNPKMLLDVCSGTGDMAIMLSKYSDADAKIFSIDYCLPMLRKATAKSGAKDINFAISDSKMLPFADNTFDVVTISFATRNINKDRDTLIEFFNEFRRVLKPEGRFINLETSQPKTSVIRGLFHLYVKLFIFPIGYLISGSKDAYKYLSHTIPRFMSAEELSDVLYESGFGKVEYSPLTLGIASIHTAFK